MKFYTLRFAFESTPHTSRLPFAMSLASVYFLVAVALGAFCPVQAERPVQAEPNDHGDFDVDSFMQVSLATSGSDSRTDPYRGRSRQSSYEDDDDDMEGRDEDETLEYLMKKVAEARGREAAQNP